LIPARFISDIHFFCHRQKSTFHFFCLSSIANGENACTCIRDISVCNNRGLHLLLIASCPIMPHDYHIYFNTIQSFFPVRQIHTSYITHSPILPSTSRTTKNRIRLRFFFFESTKRPMISLAFLSQTARDRIISPAKSCLNGLRSLGPPSTIRPLCVPCIASWQRGGKNTRGTYRYSRSSEMGDRQ
jgi:hypothetical protein